MKLPLCSKGIEMFYIFLALLAVPALATKGNDVGAALQGPQCRTKVCDDRPECPESSCRCLFASRVDCAVYYQCVNGKPFQYTCSPGLIFNAETLSCDYSYNVNCSFSSTSIIAERTTTEAASTSETSKYITTTKEPTVEITTPKSYDVTTTQPTEATTKIPTTYETTTSKGSTELSSTTSGTSEDTTTAKMTTTEVSTPNYPDVETTTVTTNIKTTTEDVSSTVKVQTTTNSSPTSTTTLTTPSEKPTTPKENTTTVSTTTTASSTVQNSTERQTTPEVTTLILPAEFDCPSRFGLFPDSSSCFRFYQCSHWIPYHMWCPTDLHFNPNLTVCDYPYRAGCDLNATEAPVQPTEMLNSTSSAVEITTEVITETTSNNEPYNTTMFIPSSTYPDTETVESTTSEDITSVVAEGTTAETPIRTTEVTTKSPTTETETALSSSNSPTERTIIPGESTTDRQSSYKTDSSDITSQATSDVFPTKERTTDASGIETTTSKSSPKESSTTFETIKDTTTTHESTAEISTTDSPDIETTTETATAKETTTFKTTNITASSTTQYTIKSETTQTTPEVTTLSPPTQFDCPSRFGLFPDPNSCFRFYHCSHWIPYHKWCPSDLHFNPNLKVCDWPYRAGCEESSQTTTTAEDPATHQNDTRSPCDCDRCDLPIPGDCTAYLQCTELVATRKQCGHGLYFNPMTGTCDLQENVQCTKEVQCPGTGRFLYPGSCSYFVECRNGNKTVRKCPEGLQFNESSEMCSWTGSCSGQLPDPNPDDKTFIDIAICEGCSYCFKSYARGCSSYVRCFQDTATEELCPPGLFFKPSTELCDHDCYVDCPEPEPQLECPKMFGLFPYPGECDLYLQCMNGTATVKRCPGVLHFNAAKKHCDWPWSAACGDSGSTPTPELYPVITDCDCDCCLTSVRGDCRSYILCIDKVGFEGTCSSGLLFNPLTENCDFAENVECNSTSPDVPGYTCPEHQGLFPHPEDCRKFIHCDHGIPHVKNCPSNLHFNPQLKVCDWPYSAGCQSFPIIPPDVEDNKMACDICNSCFMPIDGDCASYIYCRNGTGYKLRCTESLLFNPSIEACDLASNVDCPNPHNMRCPKPDGLFPAQDCSQFLHCSNGIAYLKDCPDGLHFNAQTLVCDWPEAAYCGKTPPEPTKPANDDGGGGNAFNQTCDCDCCFLPNTKDCSKYFLCLDDYLYEGQCSRGLLFNPSIQNCDFAERVTCGEDSPKCPEPNGLFLNADDCSSFVRCTSGTPRVEHCQNGTHFSAERDQCLSPCEAKCDSAIDCQTTSSTSVAPPSTEALICIDPDGFYPAPNDCSSFYMCSSGKPYRVMCPAGLHYNTEYEVCEDPCDANCDLSLDCYAPTTPKTPSSTNSPHCPEQDGLYPVPKDCTAYYLCSDGKEHLIHCPPGLHFGEKLQSCKDPCVALCNASVDCSTTTKQVDTSSTVKPTSSECTEPNGLFRNPEDCESFYQCSNGMSHLIRCPSGLHFSLDDSACERPCLAGCDMSLSCPTEIPDTEGNCTCDGCYLPDPSDCSAFYFCSRGSLAKSYCPVDMLFDKQSVSCQEESTAGCDANGDPGMCPDQFGYFPYPGDCRKFVHCDRGVAHVKDCAGNLEFDPANRVCSNPKGYCGEPAVDPKCPEPTGLFPDPGNCSVFYHCEHGVSYPKHCSSPLLFNPFLEVCDWPENVDCDSGISHPAVSSTVSQSSYPSSPSPSTNSTPRYHISSTVEPCYVVPGVTCPCACRVPTYDDCSSFFQCLEDGTACKKYCPDGLYFNKRELVCDLPENLECRDFFFTTIRRTKYLSQHPISPSTKA